MNTWKYVIYTMVRANRHRVSGVVNALRRKIREAELGWECPEIRYMPEYRQDPFYMGFAINAEPEQQAETSNKLADIITQAGLNQQLWPLDDTLYSIQDFEAMVPAGGEGAYFTSPMAMDEEPWRSRTAYVPGETFAEAPNPRACRHLAWLMSGHASGSYQWLKEKQTLLYEDPQEAEQRRAWQFLRNSALLGHLTITGDAGRWKWTVHPPQIRELGQRGYITGQQSARLLEEIEEQAGAMTVHEDYLGFPTVHWEGGQLELPLASPLELPPPFEEWLDQLRSDRDMELNFEKYEIKQLVGSPALGNALFGTGLYEVTTPMGGRIHRLSLPNGGGWRMGAFYDLRFAANRLMNQPLIAEWQEDELRLHKHHRWPFDYETYLCQLGGRLPRIDGDFVYYSSVPLAAAEGLCSNLGVSIKKDGS